MAHQVFVGIAEDVVVIRPVAREVELRILENRDQVGEPFNKLFATTKLGLVVEVGEVALAQLLVSGHERGDDLLVDVITDFGLSF